MNKSKFIRWLSFGSTRAGRRYIFFAGLVAAVTVTSLILLGVLMTFRNNGQGVDARLDSPGEYRVSTETQPTKHITMAVAPVINSMDTFPAWKDLSLYVGEKLSLSVDLIQRRTYQEVNTLLERQEVELALVCSGPYVYLRQLGVAHLLVVPKVRGAIVYHSYLIVRANSPFQSMRDLRGHSFAFTDPLSNSGKLYPTFMLAEMDEKPDTFFSSTIFTYGHDRSILAVDNEIVDGAAVDSLVFEDITLRRPEMRKRLRIIHRSPPFGINPIVIRPDAPRKLKRELRKVFLSMHKDNRGQAILKALGIEAFQDGNPKDYRIIEKMLNTLSR